MFDGGVELERYVIILPFKNLLGESLGQTYSVVVMELGGASPIALAGGVGVAGR